MPDIEITGEIRQAIEWLNERKEASVSARRNPGEVIVGEEARDGLRRMLVGSDLDFDEVNAFGGIAGQRIVARILEDAAGLEELVKAIAIDALLIGQRVEAARHG